MSGTFTEYTCTGLLPSAPPSDPQSSHSLRQILAATSCARFSSRDETGLMTTPYDMAMQGMWLVCCDRVDDEGPVRGTESAPASAAPRVPEERAKAVEEFRPSVRLSARL